MATTSNRSISIATTQASAPGFTATNTYSAAANTVSPGQTDLVTLASGANTITPPAGGSTPKACTIIPPASNIITITLKGVTGDTGVSLHLTDPSSIALGSPTATFVLTAGAELAGVRLIWT